MPETETQVHRGKGRPGQERRTPPTHTQTHSHQTHRQVHRKRPDTGGHLDDVLMLTPRTETKADTHTDVHRGALERPTQAADIPTIKEETQEATRTHVVTNTETLTAKA